MKIAQVVCTYPPYHGGMGTVAFAYTEYLRPRGHLVHVFPPRYQKGLDPPPYVHRMPSPVHWGNAGVMPSLLFRLSGFDVVHLHYPFFGGEEQIIVRKAVRPNQPLVMTYHMDWVGKGLKHLLFDAHRRVLFPWIVERVDCILVSSKSYMETSALATIPSAMAKGRILPFGVDTQFFHPGDKRAMRRRFGVSEHIPLFLFIGGLDRPHYFKGISVLLKALTGMQKESWQCVVIGDGDLRQMFEQQALDAGCKNRVRFFGHASEEEKADWLRAADFHIFPSIDRSEAFGLVALEAGSSGIPTIASDLPGVREIVADGETGRLVPPDDPVALRAVILELMRDPIRCDTMGKAARQRVEKLYEWEFLMDRLEGIYRELTHERII